jgi:hypothetical protein
LSSTLALQVAKVVFPGWICRFYTDGTVPKDIMDKLQAEGNVEFKVIKDIGGGIAGMFWRFLVADDQTVDR